MLLLARNMMALMLEFFKLYRDYTGTHRGIGLQQAVYTYTQVTIPQKSFFNYQKLFCLFCQKDGLQTQQLVAK